MSFEDNNSPKEDISKMEELSQKIISYELNNKNRKRRIAPLLEETIEQCQEIQSPKRDTSQTLSLFRKYLHERAQQAMAMGNAQGSEPIKSQGDIRLLERPSVLINRLLPQASQSSSKALSNSSSKGQLTIFYSGAVNVFNNVPVGKVQAIMHLASESSLLEPLNSKSSISGPPPRCTNSRVSKMHRTATSSPASHRVLKQELAKQHDYS